MATPIDYYIDLVDKRFGRLLAIKVTGRNKHEHTVWLCQCDCGNTTKVQRGSLVRGLTRSCGCLAREVTGNRRRLPKGEAVFNALIRSYRRHAKKANREFSLTEKQFREITKQNCHYCGQEPNQVFKRNPYNGGYIYNGIDRIDNMKGYVIDNCVSCCELCNWMKRDLSQIEFLSHIDQIAQHNISFVSEGRL